VRFFPSTRLIRYFPGVQAAAMADDSESNRTFPSFQQNDTVQKTASLKKIMAIPCVVFVSAVVSRVSVS
jgi:hypothetical protein